MVRLHVFAEGQTEQTFATNVLAPHLAARGVFLMNAMLVAHARKKGVTHRGGGRKYGAMKKDIDIQMKGRLGSDVFFTTMIGLYAIHHDFPGREKAENLRHDAYARVAFLEKAWQEDVGSRRFIPYIQLHEFEAYLFTDVEAFDRLADLTPRGRRALREIVDANENPELINDGRATAPSKRILNAFPGYKKTVDGLLIAESIGLPRIREKCPHFHEWLTKLEGLGPADATGG